MDKSAVQKAATVPEINTEGIELQILRTPEELNELEFTTPIFLKVLGDRSHIEKPEVYGICILSTKKKLYYINCEEPKMLEETVSCLNREQPGFAGHDLKDDYYMLMRHGLTECNTFFDTAVGQYVLESGRSNYNLKTLAYEYFHESLEDEKDFSAGKARWICSRI